MNNEPTSWNLGSWEWGGFQNGGLPGTPRDLEVRRQSRRRWGKGGRRDRGKGEPVKRLI